MEVMNMNLNQETLKIAMQMIDVYGDKEIIGNYKYLNEKTILTKEEEELLKDCFED